MKRWTQGEVDRWCMGGVDGCMRLPQGDYRDVDFGGRHRVIIGAYSILGDGVELGANCELGDHCEIGDRFCAMEGLTVGTHCRFGIEADIPKHSRIGRECTFGRDADVAKIDVEIGDGVELYGRCRLFGIPCADSKTLIKIDVKDMPTIYAFRTMDGNIFVHMRDDTNTLEDFRRIANYLRNARQLKAAADYLRAAYQIMPARVMLD